ncbi:MAG TPA: TonB-dependent receptor [Steroidobacteraceae bacterium]
MNRSKGLAAFGISVLFGTFSMAAFADGEPARLGAIVGLLEGADHAPLAHVTVTAVKADGSAVRATLSGSDGLYTFADLPAGEWMLSVASPQGEVGLPKVSVAPAKATRLDFAQNAAPKTPTLAQMAPIAGAPALPNAPSNAPAQVMPKALEAPEATKGVDDFTPFAFGDFTWLNGSPRNKEPAFDTKFFTPDIRLDVHYMQDFNGPKDHTIVGSTESFRSGEFQLEQISLGGDFHWDNVRARILTMYGLFSTTTPRNDASSSVGQWDLSDAYRYLSEANIGYHFDVSHGLNVDAGIFVSYIGLFSYYNYDNWTYQPSFVSSNTPWFFNGLRIQWFPTNKLKIEPWIINGWQSYARFNGHLGYGGQILYQPTENLKLVFNNYGVGEDNLGLPHTVRYHTDDSVEYRYFNNPGAAGISKMAFSLTTDAGCQSGGGLHCTGGPNKSSFLGFMLYNRLWFHNDLFAVTVGGGAMNNPGRYLTLLPPINGATAASGTPYFTENPGQPAHQWDSTVNFQYMPKQWITWWTELGYRHSDIPYFAGEGGVTPPGGNNGSPQYFTCNSGATAGTADPNAAERACNNQGGVWYPDLRTRQLMWSAGMLVKF